MLWNDKPYHSLDYELRKCFGEKVYKLALDGGMTCPNRDGTLGVRGCIFCSQGGSGDFAEPQSHHLTLEDQIEAAKMRVSRKMKAGGRYIAYFQSYTNTYAPVEYLEDLFSRVLRRPDIAALSIATRPDCLPPETLRLLERLNSIKPVWVELGLQTLHESTARFIRRGYPLSCFEKAFSGLKSAGLTVITHVILGLPGENREMMLQTTDYLGRLGTDGIKLQLLHVLRGTDLAEYYERTHFPVFTLEEYVDLVIDCAALLPPRTVLHRLSGDGPKSLLIAPSWSADKRLFLNTLHKRFQERSEFQGSHWGVTAPASSM